jgi:hypothetical protein
LIECGEIHIFFSSAYHNNIPKENHYKNKQTNTSFFDASTLQHGVLPYTISRIRLPRGLIRPQQELPHVISSIIIIIYFPSIDPYRITKSKWIWKSSHFMENKE